MTTPHPSSIFDCDFESETCASWSIVSTPQLTWTRAQGVTASQYDQHNPFYDHTAYRPNGYYLLLQPNKTVPFPNVRKEWKIPFVLLIVYAIILFLFFSRRTSQANIEAYN